MNLSLFNLFIAYLIVFSSSCVFNLKNGHLNFMQCELGCVNIDFGATTYFYAAKDKLTHIEYLKNTDSEYYDFLLNSNFINTPYIFIWHNNILYCSFMTEKTFIKIENYKNNLEFYLVNNKKIKIKMKYKTMSFKNEDILYVEDILFIEEVEGITKCK
jgi:hypothetical protein